MPMIPILWDEIEREMVKAIKKTPFEASPETPVDGFLLCGKGAYLRPDTIITSRGSMTIPDMCSDGTKPAGFFFVQPQTNSYWGGGNHVIAREVLKGLFVDDDYGFACSGYSRKVLNSEDRSITKHPKLLCVAPKQGATKAEIGKTIKKLDTVFNMGQGFNSNGYTRVLKSSFDVKRWNLESRKG